MFMHGDAVGATMVAAADGIPITRPFINAREAELVAEVLGSSELSRGPMLARFERAFATTVEARHAIGTSSACAALRAVAAAADWGPGSEIITTPLASPSILHAIRGTGASISFVDVDPVTFTIDVDAVAASITTRVHGIVASDMLGWPSDMDGLARIASRHGLDLVEDATHALGARRSGRPVGGGDWVSVFGFDAGQQLATGEGGMACVPDDSHAAAVRLHVDRDDARMSDLTSAVGVAQLEKLSRALVLRQMVAGEYAHLLRDVPGIALPTAGADRIERAWFGYSIQLDGAIDRDSVAQRMQERGIECRPWLLAAHLQQTMRASGWTRGMFPTAEQIADQSLALPFFPQMSPQQQQRVVAELRDVLEHS